MALQAQISPISINRIEGESRVDLRSGAAIAATGPAIPIAPCQCRWISFRG